VASVNPVATSLHTLVFSKPDITGSGLSGESVIISAARHPARANRITVNPEPVMSGLLNTNVCSDVATGLTLATDGISVAAANYNITARTIAAGLTPLPGTLRLAFQVLRPTICRR